MKFSIITICFNSKKTIEKTLKSVLAQTYSNYEYLIVDGLSNDGTLDIIKEYEPLFDGRMKWVSEPDKGIYDAMNKGVVKAKGEIIGIVNSDDWLEPETLAIIENLATTYGTSNVVYTGNIRYIYNDGSNQIIRRTKTEMGRYCKRYEMALNHPATFIPKKVYEQFGLYDTNLKLQADCDLINRLYRKDVGFVFVDKVLSNQSDGGASTKSYYQSLKDYNYILHKNGVRGISYYLLSWRYRTKKMIKRFMPQKLLVNHRR